MVIFNWLGKRKQVLLISAENPASDKEEDEVDTSPMRRQKWALLYREGKGDLWSSSFRLACRDKTGPAWERDPGKLPAEMSDLGMHLLLGLFETSFFRPI